MLWSDGKNLAASSVGHFLSKAPTTNKRVVTRRIVFRTKDARSVRNLPRCQKFISIISREHRIGSCAFLSRGPFGYHIHRARYGTIFAIK